MTVKSNVVIGPGNFSVEVKCRDSAAAEDCVNLFAVGCRRWRCKRILATLFRRGLLEHFGVPEDVSASAINTNHMAILTFVRRGRYKHSIAMNNRRRPSFARNRRLPGNILRCTPTQWHAGFRGNALSRRTAKSRPVFSHRCRHKDQEASNRKDRSMKTCSHRISRKGKSLNGHLGYDCN